MNATNRNGQLVPLSDCYIRASGSPPKIVYMNNLPEISDSKSASYSEENAMGRSVPVKSFANGGTRKIGWKMKIVAPSNQDQLKAIDDLRFLESCVYPKADPSNILPYIPPRVLSIKCGRLLADYELSVILTDYNVDFPTDQPWSSARNVLYLPYMFNLSLTFEVVYDSRYLPGADRIITLGG
jgi:hypothetical protein